MILDGLRLTDSSVAENLIIQSGDDLPLTNLNKGELFFLNNVGLHVYNGSEWEKAAGDDAPISHVGAGDIAHANVIAGGAAGFMTGADKTKLDGIASGATANNTNAQLLDRANHTGAQAISTVTGLQNAIDSLVPVSTKGAANGVAALDGNGKVPESQLPAVVISDVFSVASEAAMLALNAERGDIAVRSDLNKTFALSSAPSTTLGNWVELRSPTDAVLSVAGKTGVVTLSKADVGLSNVDNTADSAKPISTAAATALAGKAPLTGTGTSGTWPINVSGNAATATASNGANATWNSALVTSTASDTAASAVIRSPVGGSGDASVASLGFLNGAAYGLKMYLRADGYFGIGGWSRAAWGWYLDGSNNMTCAGNVTAYSDPRLKENFKRIDDPMAILNKLDGGTFNWRYGIAHIQSKAGKRDYGVLADQVEAVMPEIVARSVEIDGESYRTVAYDKLVPVLIEAVKCLEKRIAELEGK